MKTVIFLLGLAVALSAANAQSLITPAPSVGVYDSRAVSFAYFWSEPHQKQLKEKVAAAKAAQQSGDQAVFADRSRALAEDQKRFHLQVFSTAPANEAMAALLEQLPAIQRELGVERFVSKWDLEALRTVPAASRIDVTDRLVREFNIPLQRQKTLDDLKTKTPLPLDEARRLADAGKL